MNPLIKPAFVVFSESARAVSKDKGLVSEERRKKTILGDKDELKRKSQEFLTKREYKSSPGSLLSELEKRLSLIEINGEVTRLKILVRGLKKSKKYSPGELHALESKLDFLKNQVKKRIPSLRDPLP